jgi:DNA repair photolyase
MKKIYFPEMQKQNRGSVGMRQSSFTNKKVNPKQNKLQSDKEKAVALETDELQNSHSSVFECGLAKGATHAISLNSYPNGVSISVSRACDYYKWSQAVSNYDPFFLRTRDTREFNLPDGKFIIFRENFKVDLDSFFANLNKKGILASSVIYFGVNSDPFHAYHKKFAQTAACIDILERYKAARVVVQSRSRMILTALPLLKLLQGRAYCVIPFETRLEKAISRYTPGQPRLEERLITAAGLQAQGIKITFAATPLLPFGETSGDLWKFAELLVKYSDNILLQPLCTGSRENESILKKLALAQKLESDHEVAFLRPKAEENLRNLIIKLSAKHLEVPSIETNSNLQLNLFAA